METGYRMYLVAELGLSDNTVKRYRADLQRVEQQLTQRGKTLGTANREDFQSALVGLASAGHSSLTVRFAFHGIRSWLKYRAICGEDTQPIMEYLQGPKVPLTLPRVPNEAEIRAVFEAILARSGRRTFLRDTAMFEVLYASGIRASELCDLTVEAVDWAAPSLRVRGKGAKDRIVRINQNAIGALQAYLLPRRAAPTDPLFTTRSAQPLDRQQVHMIVRKWGRWAKLPAPLYPHLLRHACATHLLGRLVEQGRGGEALLIVRDHLGHEDVETTQRYTHLDKGTLKRWHQRFAPVRMA
jgi:integrase/recombinase XerD